MPRLPKLTLRDFTQDTELSHEEEDLLHHASKLSQELHRVMHMVQNGSFISVEAWNEAAAVLKDFHTDYGDMALHPKLRRNGPSKKPA
jgi:hypothetical protein